LYVLVIWIRNLITINTGFPTWLELVITSKWRNFFHRFCVVRVCQHQLGFLVKLCLVTTQGYCVVWSWTPDNGRCQRGCTKSIIIIIVKLMPMFMLLSSLQGHRESLFGSFWWMQSECQGPPTLRPSQSIWALSLHVGCCHLHPLSQSVMITQPEDWHSFYISHRVEGWVDLGGWSQMTEMF